MENVERLSLSKCAHTRNHARPLIFRLPRNLVQLTIGSSPNARPETARPQCGEILLHIGRRKAAAQQPSLRQSHRSLSVFTTRRRDVRHWLAHRVTLAADVLSHLGDRQCNHSPHSQQLSTHQCWTTPNVEDAQNYSTHSRRPIPSLRATPRARPCESVTAAMHYVNAKGGLTHCHRLIGRLVSWPESSDVNPQPTVRPGPETVHGPGCKRSALHVGHGSKLDSAVMRPECPTQPRTPLPRCK